MRMPKGVELVIKKMCTTFSKSHTCGMGLVYLN
jgi:hypothetical protein